MDSKLTINDVFRAIIRDENEKLLNDIRELLSVVKEAKNNSKPMNLDEACDYLSCSASYLYKLTSAKEIPHSKRGKRLIFFKKELDEWLLDGKIKLSKSGSDALYRVLKARRA